MPCDLPFRTRRGARRRGRRRAFGLAGLVVAAAGVAGCDAGPRPNVLLVVIDTLRADHTSLHGYPLPTTPALQALAAEGAHAAQAYASTSVTTPSVASVLTGRPPIAHRVIRNGLPLPADERTLAEVLAERGYDTAAVVSSFALDRRFGLDQGFARYDDAFDPETASVGARDDWEGFAVSGAFDRRAEATTDRAIHWLEERQPDRPFFLFVHYFDPHSPYRPPPDYTPPFGPGESEAAEPSLADAAFRYDAEIAYTDAQLGRLLAHLDGLGAAPETLVVVTADHGEGLGERGYVFHGAFVFDEEVRVPLVFRWPGVIGAGLVLRAPVSLVDVTPTLLALLDLDAPEGLTGQSLAAALRGERPLDPRRAVFLHRRAFERGRLGGAIPVAGQKYGVRQGRWKYVDGPAQGTRELFDLERDPAERENRYYDDPEVARRLADRLGAWREAHTAADPPAPDVPEADRRALRALGYEQ